MWRLPSTQSDAGLTRTTPAPAIRRRSPLLPWRCTWPRRRCGAARRRCRRGARGGQPDRGGGADAVPGGEVGHRGTEAGLERVELLRRRVDDHDDELVAADPGDGVDGPHRGRQPRRHRPQHVVAGDVAVHVVDRLEPVDVAEPQHDPAVAEIGERSPEPLPFRHAREGDASSSSSRVGLRRVASRSFDRPTTPSSVWPTRIGHSTTARTSWRSTNSRSDGARSISYVVDGDRAALAKERHGGPVRVPERRAGGVADRRAAAAGPLPVVGDEAVVVDQCGEGSVDVGEPPRSASAPRRPRPRASPRWRRR